METNYGFTKLSPDEFAGWLKDLRLSRTIMKIQQHHTYIPSYVHFDGTNHFERQKAMKDFHVNSNGWADIGQHFTIFPDGFILTGRSMENSPACILGQNANAICIENFGNFDKGADVMTKKQQDSIIGVTALLCTRFNIPVSTNFIVYHHWFNLITGARNDGTGNNKSCPGTAFFGGNKVEDCQKIFLPLVEALLSGTIKKDISGVEKYVCVTAQSLNVRTRPASSAPRASDRLPVTLGSVLRVYDEKNGWLKISNSKPRWVSARFTTLVQRAEVTASVLNVRTGPGTSFPKASSLQKGEIVFITKTINGWSKIGLEEKWVSNSYIKSVEASEH